MGLYFPATHSVQFGPDEPALHATLALPPELLPLATSLALPASLTLALPSSLALPPELLPLITTLPLPSALVLPPELLPLARPLALALLLTTPESQAATAVENCPCSHSLHEDDPADVVYFPGSHVSHHKADPVDALYVPVTHGVHVPSLSS
jgi:hypothetical protein